MSVSILPICISAIALAISIASWVERRSLDRRDLFLKLNERLLDFDLQHGRRILTREVSSRDDVRRMINERFEDYEAISRALSMLDLAALYVQEKYVAKRLFTREWGAVYVELMPKFEILIAEKAEDDPLYLTSWRHFRKLAAEMTRGRN